MNSIEQTGSDVHAKHPGDNTNANTQAGTESTIHQSTDAPNTNLNQGNVLLAKDLKNLISIRELMESDGHRFKHTGSYFMCCCPFHPDRTPSFGIREDDDSTGKCFGCGWYGNIFDYEMQFHKLDFTTAWIRLNDFYYECPRENRKATRRVKKPKLKPTILTQKQRDEREKYASRLETDRWIAEEICRKRYEYNGEKWNPNTLQGLAIEGPLGWAGDAVAFMYPTGTKFRKWPGRDFYWDCDRVSLWRRHIIPCSDHIYITEGETDAIAMIDMGFEHTPGVAIVAAPSATSFYPEWAPLFQGKKVTLCFDNDEEGQRGSDRAGKLIQPYASELLVLDLEGAI